MTINFKIALEKYYGMKKKNLLFAGLDHRWEQLEVDVHTPSTVLPSELLGAQPR